MNSRKTFEDDLEAAKNKLFNLIPYGIVHTPEETEKSNKENNYDESYGQWRYRTILENTSKEEWLIYNYLKRKKLLDYRREQLTLLEGAFKHIKNVFQYKLALLSESVNSDDSSGKMTMEVLLRGASLATKYKELTPTSGTEGYIYLIKEDYSGRYKIGRTNNVAKRAEIFNVKLPFEWTFIAVYLSKDCFHKERKLHSRFREQRVNGEWFELNSEHLLLFFEMMSGYTREEAIRGYELIDRTLREKEEELLAERRNENDTLIFNTDISSLEEKLVSSLKNKVNR